MDRICDFGLWKSYEPLDGRATNMIEFCLECNDHDNVQDRVYLRMYPNDTYVQASKDMYSYSYKDVESLHMYYEIVSVYKNNQGYSSVAQLFEGYSSTYCVLPHVASTIYEYLVKGTDLDNKRFTSDDGTLWFISRINMKIPVAKGKLHCDGCEGYWFYLYKPDNSGYRFFVSEEDVLDFYNTLVQFLSESIEHAHIFEYEDMYI